MTVYDGEQRRVLLELAELSIRHGLAQGRALAVDANDYPRELRELRATFVTLKQGGELRGCIGGLEAARPLVADVARHAYAAAFEDPRFPALAAAELAGLQLEISVLTPAEPMDISSETDLVNRLRPGEDGLILQEGSLRGTFLPAVWEALPQPAAFVHHLKLKAGLPMNYWSPTLRFFRYRTESFGRHVGE